MIEALIEFILNVLAPTVGMVSFFFVGWFAREAKYNREKKAKEFLTACGVYDEKPKNAVEDGNY